MRTLEYKIIGQRILTIGNHSGLVSGTKGYLHATFAFDQDWEGCIKVVSFFNDEKEYAVLLDETNSCEIPAAALTGPKFEIAIEGRKDDYRILSRKIKETQTVREV